MKTQVAIIGAGPTGLLLSRMLHNRGIESVIIENRDEQYLRSQKRAGVLDGKSVDILEAEGVGEDAKRKGMVYNGLLLLVNGSEKEINFSQRPEGRQRIIYRQDDLTNHLLDKSSEDNLNIIWEAKGQRMEDLDKEETTIHYSLHGKLYTMQCEYMVGCDGWMGICRPTVESYLGKGKTQSVFYPFSWYGALVEEDNSGDWAVKYELTDEGFAYKIPTSKTTSRLYVQCENGTDPDAWSDDKMKKVFEQRLGVTNIKILKKRVHTMCMRTTEHLRYGNLFLAGDAVHYLPLTMGKGLNLAIAEIRRLADAFQHLYQNNDANGLDSYETECVEGNRKVIEAEDKYTLLFHKDMERRQANDRERLVELNNFFASKEALQQFADAYA